MKSVAAKIANKAKSSILYPRERLRSASSIKNAKRMLANLPKGDYSVKPDLPYQSQFASRNLVSKILNREIKSTDDPNWKSYDYPSEEEYDYWSWRTCGLFCVKMILDAYDKIPQKTVARLA